MRTLFHVSVFTESLWFHAHTSLSFAINRVFFRLGRSVVKCLDLKKLFRFKYFTGEGSEFRTDVSFSIVWSLIAAAWSSISASKRDLDT